MLDWRLDCMLDWKFFSDCGKSYAGLDARVEIHLRLRKIVCWSKQLPPVQHRRTESVKVFPAKLHFMKVKIVWKFNPPAAPHFGGIWERLVQIFKLSLYKLIGSRTLTDEIYCTTTCEIEANMNSRPLTNVQSDINDPLPLTPNHFLLGSSSVNLPPGVFVGDEKNISKARRTLQQIASHFCNRFLREYLPGEQIRSKWSKSSKNLKVDDLVWILEDFTSQGLWPVARVTQVIPGENGIVRSVKLKTPSGERIRRVVKLSKLFLD